MALPWNELWQTLGVNEPQHDSGLQVFGLRWHPDSTLRYLTLDEAMAAGSLEVAEISESGSVPQLKVTNRSELMTFLMAGEQLKGAKQNRVLNVSVMVPGRKETLIPVSCVEAGRWSARPSRFTSGGSMSHSMLRKLMSLDTHQGYQTRGTPSSDQGKVWREVARKLEAMGSVSPSQEFDQVYQDHQSRLDLLLARFAVPADCQGAAFAIGGRVVGADLFDQTATLSRLWPKLIRGFALDALETKPSETTALAEGASVKQWLDGVVHVPLERFQSPGAGQDLRFETPALAGSALLVDDQPVHVELFADPKV